MAAIALKNEQLCVSKIIKICLYTRRLFLEEGHEWSYQQSVSYAMYAAHKWIISKYMAFLSVQKAFFA